MSAIIDGGIVDGDDGDDSENNAKRLEESMEQFEMGKTVEGGTI